MCLHPLVWRPAAAASLAHAAKLAVLVLRKNARCGARWSLFVVRLLIMSVAFGCVVWGPYVDISRSGSEKEWLAASGRYDFYPSPLPTAFAVFSSVVARRRLYHEANRQHAELQVRQYGEARFVCLSPCARVSIVLRASSDTILEEAKRALNDAVCIVDTALRDPVRIVDWFVCCCGFGIAQ